MLTQLTTYLINLLSGPITVLTLSLSLYGTIGYYHTRGFEYLEQSIGTRIRTFKQEFTHEVATQAGYIPPATVSSMVDSVRTRHFTEIAREQSELTGLNYCLILAVIEQESQNGKYQLSKAGARGLLQLMPGTAKEMLGLVGDDQILDPENNIPAGVKYLNLMIKQFGVYKGIQAYNSGPGRIGKTEENIKYPELVLDKWVRCNEQEGVKS